VNELNDPELEELERKLAAAFTGTRPRRGFEDELWTRLERRRGSRLLSWRPDAWPALGAFAAVLVIGLGLLTVPRLISTSSPASRPQAQTGSALPRPVQRSSGAAGAARPQQAEAAPGSFGRLPAPALIPPSGIEPAAAGQPVPYYGPAHLKVTAQLPAVPATLPVYRYRQPAATDLDAFAAQLGASRAGVAGTPTIYRSPDFMLNLTPGSASQEPRFVISAVSASAASPAGGDSRQVADAFLSAHPPLAPGWPEVVQVQPAAGGQAVVYQREFDVPGGQAGQVDSGGSAAGTRVEVAGGSVTGASGPLPATQDTSQYRTRPSSQVASDAAAAQPAAPSGASPLPSFELSKVSLVYMAAGSGDYGYYVPVYLFTGTASTAQGTLERRLAVPALDASQLG
jgi:hypothetical protein